MPIQCWVTVNNLAHVVAGEIYRVQTTIHAHGQKGISPECTRPSLASCSCFASKGSCSTSRTSTLRWWKYSCRRRRPESSVL